MCTIDDCRTILVAQAETGSRRPSQGVAPARDGRFAIEEEFAAALRAGTLDAWDLFLARHPNSHLASAAKAQREKLLPSAR